MFTRYERVRRKRQSVRIGRKGQTRGEKMR